jgi:uncharacterized protein
VVLPDFSACGFLLYRRTKRRLLYLTLVNARHGDVGAPKGHTQGGEGALETATRETMEETGLARDEIRPHLGWRRVSRYAVGRGEKEVVYLLARATRKRVRISEEHESYAWLDLDETLDAIRHEDLRGFYRQAAVWLRDPILRRGLSPEQARGLLERERDASEPLLVHSRAVAGAARTLAEQLQGPDPDFVEAAAWLHDIGRTRTHGNRHPIEGFDLMVRLGHPGYAHACLTHYTKGIDPAALDLEPAYEREMRAACDPERFPIEERLIALADAMAMGPRLATLDERYADLRKRYGPSRFFDRVERRAHKLKAAYEKRTGAKVYRLLGIG